MSSPRTTSFIAKFPSAARLVHRTIAFFPLTWLGILVGVLSVAFLRFIALKDLDLVVLAMGYGSLAVLALSTFNVVVGAILLYVFLRRPLAVPRDADTPSIETGRDTPTGLAMRTLRFLPFVHVRCYWPAYPSAVVTLKDEGSKMIEFVRFFERGRYGEIERRWDVVDVFGLTKISLHTKPFAISFSVLPAPMTLTENLVLQAMLAGDEQPHPLGVEAGDRVDIRRYDPTDPARFIHWKLYARTGKLMTRVPERALAPARRTLAFFVAGEHDEATASLARWAIETRAFGTAWRFGADGSAKDSQFAKEALSMLVESASAKAHGGRHDLLPFLARNETAGQSSLVLFVPGAIGPWLASVVQVAAQRKDRVKVLIGTSFSPFARNLVTSSNPAIAYLERAIFRDADARLSNADEVVAAFRRVGVEPKIIGVSTQPIRHSYASDSTQVTSAPVSPLKGAA